MKKALRLILILVCIAAFCYSAYMLLSTAFEYKKAENFYDQTALQYTSPAPPKVVEPEQPEKDALPDHTKPAEQTPSAEEAPPEPQAPIVIDFDSLLATNSDVVGWIYSEGTVINYPIARGDNNDKYLHHMLDGRYNSSGTLFLDYRCEKDLSSDNSVIYGHNMKNGSMFHSLVDYEKQAYYDEHPAMYLLTPEQDYILHVVAGFVTGADSWVYQFDLSEDGAKEAFLNQCIANSDFKADYTPSAADRIVTLSTCTYDYSSARYVIIGALEPIN